MSEYARLVVAVDSTQVKTAERDLQSLGAQSRQTESAVVGMAGKIASAFAGLKLAEQIRDVTMLASRYDQMGLVMKTVGENTGRSTVELEALDQALQDTGISALQSRNNIIRMMSANIDLSKATQLASLAQDAAVIANTNSSEAFERLIRGIQSAEKETLETMGLNVNFAQSYENLAVQLGKKADQLTVVERVQAGVNAALAAGANIAGAYDASMENAGKQLGSTTRHLENFQIALGKTWQPEFSAGVAAYSNTLKFLNENVEAVAQTIETSLYVSVGLAATAIGRKTVATVSSTLASRAQAVEELRLAKAHAATTASALAHATANNGLTGATGRLTAATVAHEAALKRQAAAQAASAGVGRAILGVMGGPVGIIATVGLAALSFVDFGSKAESGMGKAVSASERAAIRIRNAMRELLPEDMGQLGLVELQAEADRLKTELVDAQSELDRFQRSFDKGNIDEQWLVGPRERVAALESALAKLNSTISGDLFETDLAGQKWMASLQQRADFAGNLTEVQRTLISIEKGYAGKLSETDRALALSNAALIDKANATKVSSKETVNFAKNLRELLKESQIATESAVAMADAYLAGADSVRALTLEQKAEEQLLKTGASSRSAVVKALKEQQDALDRLDIAKQVSDMRLQNKDLQAQIGILQSNTQSTVAGREAQRAYNIEKQLAAALAGKNADALSEETNELRRQLEVQEDLREELEARGKIAGLIDSTATAQERLNRQLEELSELRTWAETPEQVRAIDRAMQEARREASRWAEWTESALERVDSAFADAWRNIGDGFSSFRDNLTNAFKQMLAELAHLAITRPIVMQIGAAMGIGGAAGMAGIGGGSGGGMDIVGLARMGYQAYQGITGQGLVGSVVSGFQTGGLGGAWGGATGWAGGATAGLNAAAGQMYGVVTQGGAGLTTYAPLSYQMGGAGSGAAAAAPWAAGAAGAYMGYQQSGLKGAATGAAGGYLGAKGGAALGTAILPGIGTVIGAALGGLLGSSLGSKVFGGDWETRNSGLGFSVTDGAFQARAFENQKKSGGAFSSTKRRIRWRDLDPETAASFEDAYAATEEGIASLFEDLGLSVEEGTLSGLQLATARIGTKGKTEEEIQQLIGEWFAGASEAITSELNKVFGTGLDYDLAGMQAFVGNLQGVNEVIRYLDVSMYEVSVAGGKLAESLSGAAGGLEALAANSATYYAAFFTDAEKVEDTIDSITRAFESADVTLAGSRAEYRAMVENIDITTQAGQEMFATLMALSGQAAQYYSIVEEQAAQALAKIRQQADQQFSDSMSVVQAAFSRLQRSVGSEVEALRERAAELQSGTSALINLSSSLRQSLRSMRLESDAFNRSQRTRAQGELQGLIDFARGGGSLRDTDASEVLSELNRDSTQFFGSFEDYARDYWKTASDINELARLTDDQLSIDEQILQGINSQISFYDQMLADAQREIDALMGIDISVQSVEAALAGFKSAVGAVKATPQGAVQTAYQEVLGRAGDAEGVAYWTQQLATGAISHADLKRAMAEAALGTDVGKYSGPVSLADLLASQRNAADYLKVPGFAAGGLHGGGLRLVGEHGPELEVTGPSRIYSNSQTMEALAGGADTARAIASLQQTVERQGDALRSIAKHTQQTAKRVEFLERWEYDGLPEERRAV